MGAFEDFVNVELPKRISTQENGAGSGNLPVGKALVTTGIGLEVITQDFPSSIPFQNTVEILHADLLTLIANDQVSIGTFYEITDFQTVNKAGLGLISTGPIEHLIVQGLTSNTTSINVYSRVYPTDIIQYDINDIAIMTYISGEYEDNGSTGGDDFEITNWHTSYFDTTKEPLMDDDFYIYAEDDAGGEFDVDSSSEGDDFTVTDNGDGTWRITDLTGDIDFVNPDYNYMELSWNTPGASRPGKITYRKNPEKNIEAVFDWRECKYARAKLDVSEVPAWDSGTSYNVQTLVLVGSDLYISLDSDNVGHNPSSDDHYWVRALRNVDTELYCTDRIQFGYRSLNKLDGTETLLPVFCRQSGASYSFNIDNVENVSLRSKNIVFVAENAWIICDDLDFATDCTNNTFFGSIRSANFAKGSNYNVVGKSGSIFSCRVNVKMLYCVFGAYCQYNTFGDVNGVVFGPVTYSEFHNVRNSLFSRIVRGYFGYANQNLYMRAEDISMGSNNRYIFIANGFHLRLGDSNQRLRMLCNANSNNVFGDLNRYMKFSGSTLFGCSFGTNNGRSGTWLEFLSVVRGVTVGNDCFYQGNSGPFQTVQNSVFAGNNARMQMTGQVIDTNFGIGAAGIKCRNIARTTIGNGTSAIEVTNHIYDSYFAPGLNWFKYTGAGTGNFLKNRVHATHIDFTSGATHVKGNYPCEITEREDGTKRLVYTDNTDTVVAVDPTT